MSGDADEEPTAGEAAGETEGPGPEETPGGNVLRLAVLGAGTMGPGIAQVAALAGARVRLYDVDPDALDRGMARVREQLAKGVELEKVDPEDRERTLERLEATADFDRAVEEADAVVEAVPERLELKREVLRAAASGAREGALLATNTSSLSIGEIAHGVPDPERVVGMHFFNPVHIMALVEVVRGEETAPETVERAVSLAEAMDKTPIVVEDSPGFASSRLGVALGLEAIRMVQEGVAEPEAIDKAMTLGYRHPMGPLELTDLVGLDVRLEIARYLHGELEDGRPGGRFEPPALLERMVEEGRLGKKSGRGFYDWDE